MTLTLRPAIRTINAPAKLVGAFAIIVAMSLPSPALAQGAQRGVQNVQRGIVIARTYCMQCHAIDKVSPSPLTVAPPFRDLHKKYPVERLEESLAEGVVTGHPSMPEFRFDADQIGDFIAFLNSLK
jgi:mono/diheme cytochrome c family protein